MKKERCIKREKKFQKSRMVQEREIKKKKELHDSMKNDPFIQDIF